MRDVVVLGVGMHPFGRFGTKSAIDMGADAIRAALGDAGVTWKDIQFAFGGSCEVDNPDAVLGRMGRTGIPFMDVYNGCATAATALEMTADGIRSGKYDIGVAVGMDKHEGGAFTADPVNYGAPSWYGEAGLFLTTKFFGMKINRYMHDYGITHETLAKVAVKAFGNGVINPNAYRRAAMTEEQVLASRMLNYPLRQYMFCSPDEGAAAVVLMREADAAARVLALADSLPTATATATGSLMSRDGAARLRRARAAAVSGLFEGAAAAAAGGGTEATFSSAAAMRPLAAAEASPLWRELVPSESEVERRAAGAEARAAPGGGGGGGTAAAVLKGAAAEAALQRALDLVSSFEARQVEGGWVAAPSAKGGACLLRPVS